MARLLKRALQIVLSCCLLLILSPSPKRAIAQASATSPASSTSAQSSNSKSATKKSGGAPASDIAAAKASGKVWVNTDTGVYHKSGRWYGKTKTGKFMTEAEAKAAGYKEAKNQ